MNTKKIAGIGLLTAVVVVLQLLGGFIKFGPFSITLTLAPIIVGAAIYGVWAGGWLGLIFGVVVLINDSALFLAFNPAATIILVLLKGVCCGLAAGAVYRMLSRKNIWLGVIPAGLVAPIVNTGIFVIGCLLFFMPLINEWAAALDFENGTRYLFFGMIGVNFIVEMLINLILSSVIVKIITINKKIA